MDKQKLYEKAIEAYAKELIAMEDPRSAGAKVFRFIDGIKYCQLADIHAEDSAKKNAKKHEPEY